MRIYWGPIVGSDKYRVQAGDAVIECASAHEAEQEALRRAPRPDRALRVTFQPDPADTPAPKAAPVAKVASAPVADMVEALAPNAKKTIAAIRAGDHDAFLEGLKAAEAADKNRKSVLAAIAARQE